MVARWSTCSSCPGCGVNPSTLIAAPADRRREWERRHGAPHFHAWNGRYPIAELPVELDRRVAIRELAAARAKPHRDDVLGIEPRRHALEPDEAPDEQPRTDQQHQRKRHFRHDQQAAQAAARRAEAAVTLRVSAAGLEAGVEIDSRRA